MKAFLQGFFNGYLVSSSLTIVFHIVIYHKAPWPLIGAYWIGVSTYNVWKAWRE